MCIDTSTAGLERAWAGSPCLRARGGSTCAGCVCSAAGWATRSTTSPNLVALTSVAARLGRARSPKEYAELARELQFPSLPTVLNRMGGLDERDPRRRHAAAGRGDAAHARSSLDRRRLLGRAAALVSELGEIPTVLSY